MDCSRWTELTSALKFHATIAKEAGAPTEFHLLNNFDPVVIGTGDATADAAQWSKFLEILDESPGGETPLCKHIRVVVDKIRAVEQQLRANNQRACVIIASDGESTDGDIQQAMRPLKSLPVWVVVRLCTDEDRVVNYWNEIDNQLEVELDVLDDLQGEAQEVYAANPWLTYGEPLHRMREFGIPIKELDMLDSNLLSLEQLRKLCTVM